MNKLLSILIILSSFQLFSCNHTYEEGNSNYVVLVSFDGFRWDYTDMYDTPNMDRMAEDGVRADYMIPSFPTKTFPNHYTIATGLVPDHHGIINNTFYIPEMDKIFRVGDRNMVRNAECYLGEPIWVTAEKQGVVTASYFWVGTEAPIRGIHPTYWKEYDETVPFEDRIDTVIHWLNLPVPDRPRFITLYFHEPDAIGHDLGPTNEKTGEMVEYLDQLLGSLRSKLKALPIGDSIDLILVSDHGMGSITPETYINLNRHLEKSWLDYLIGTNPVYLADAAEGFEDSIVNALNVIEGVSAWKQKDIPAHLNYGTSERFPDILILADSGWSIGTRNIPGMYAGGTHGYDPEDSDMRAIFYADGPDFKDGFRNGPVNNVDIYPLISDILKIKPAETDGDLSRIRNILR